MPGDRDSMPIMCCRRVVVSILVPALLVVGTSAAHAQSPPQAQPEQAAQPRAAQPPPPAVQPVQPYPPSPYGAPPPPAPYGAYGAPYPPNGNPYAVNPQNWYLYEASKKSVALSVVIELLVPGLGSIYSDHAIGALITWAVMIAGVVVALSSVDQDQYGYATQADDDRLLLGVLLVLGGRIYGIVDSVLSANEYNSNLAARLGLPQTVAVGVTPFRDGATTAWGPSLTLRF